MVYIVIEIQAAASTAATLVNSYTDRSLAEQKYHDVLSAAAVSPLVVHSAVMMTEDGTRIKGETYRHELADNA